MPQVKQNPNNLVYLNRDQGYRFVWHDPDLVWICEQITRSGLSAEAIARNVLHYTKGSEYIHCSTVEKWMNGKTTKPQNRTLTLVVLVLGFHREWRK